MRKLPILVKVILSITVLFFLSSMYWCAVVGTSTDEREIGNDYGMQSILARLSGEKKKADSLYAIADHYWDMADKTLLSLPKCLR